MWVTGWLLRGVLLLVVASVCRPRTTVSVLAGGWLVWAAASHPLGAALLCCAVLEVGQLWSVLGGASWRRWVRPVLAARWRSVWLYRRRWRTAMRVAELDRVDRAGAVTLPRLGRVRCTPTADLVRVRALLGQRFHDWEQAGPMLAHVFGATDFRVLRGDNRRLTLELVRGRVGRSWNRQEGDPAEVGR